MFQAMVIRVFSFLQFLKIASILFQCLVSTHTGRITTLGVKISLNKCGDLYCCVYYLWQATEKILQL